MSDIDVHHLAAAYTLDALDAREREAFEAHYERCDVCRADVLEFRETMAVVADSLSTATPPSLKDRVMADIAVTRQLSPAVNAAPVPVPAHRTRPNRLLLAAAAVVLLALVGGVIGIVAGRDNGDGFNDELAAMLDQPDARMIDLPAQDGVPGSFKVAWSPSMGKAALIGEDLPAAPAGKAYELWLITPQQSMAMYVLDPADGGSVHRMLEAPEDPSAWAITVEPKTGTPVATGDIIFVAEV
ncbi:MAG: anti-sigma factor [Ilumatobacteraceae bacterium]